MKEKLKDFYSKNTKAVYIGAAVLAVLIIGLIVLLVSCENGNDGGKNGGKETEAGNAPSSFNVTVQSEGGMVFPKVDVYVYEDSSLSEMVAAAKTDDNGKMSFDSEGASKYVAVLKGVPEGYEVKEYYDITEENTVIALKTVINPVDLDNSKLEAGNVMQELEVTTPDGVTLKVSDLLKEKKVVMLNFFYLACQPCKNEFPFMQEAYATAGDDVAIIALTPVDQDDAAIKQYAEELGLTFYVAKCDNKWEQVFNISQYPTSVVIDRYGMISLMHSSSITNAETFAAIFNYYTADTYKQQVVRFVEDIINYKGEEGTEENPIEILPDATEFEANVKAEGKLYFEISKVTNMELTIQDENAYVIYEETTYNAENGVVKLVISAPDSYTPAKFVVGNNAKEDKTFKATLSGVAGTMMNPHAMNIGKFVTNIEAGNAQGVYYTYTATESGTLTLKCLSSKDDVKYDITLYNLNTYANRTLSADGNGDGTVSVDVNANDEIQIIISSMPNENNEYPEGEFNIEATFGKGETETTVTEDKDVEYTIKVTDNNGKVMSGVKVAIDTEEATTSSSGVAKVTLKAGSYTINVTAPSGYKVQGTYTVTKDKPSVTVTLVSTSAKMVKYTVKVTDETGKALNGATVIVGNNVVTTNTSGVATIELAEGSYDVAVSMNGYDSENGSVTKSSTNITIKLKKSSSQSTTTPVETVTYTVKVVDYKGTAQSGQTVLFKNNGKIAATVVSDSKGVATAKLEKGTYEVAIAFTSGSYGYDSTNAKVTASTLSTTVTIAAKAEMYKKDVYFDATGAYELKLGGQYVEVPSSDQTQKDFLGNYINNGGNAFFIYETDKSGTYKFTVSNKDAKISFWGISYLGSIYDITDTCDSTATSVTVNLKPANIPEGDTVTIIIGVKGVNDCVIGAERIGDAVLDDSDIPYTTYTAKKTPTKQNLGVNMSGMAYVDIASKDKINVVLGSDGYYHLGSATGQLLYVNLGGTGNYGLSFYTMYGAEGEDNGTTPLRRTFYKSNGAVDKKIDYTDCIRKYIANRDEATGLYPLTEDLMIMLQNGGEGAEWWNLKDSVPNLNIDNAWLFLCCYSK